MARHERIMRKALVLAKHSPHKVFPMCAILAKGNRILSVGFNSHRSHPKQRPLRKVWPCLTHAELDALAGMRDDLIEGATLYIARLKKSTKDAGCSKPCAACMGLIREKKIKKIIYFSDDENIQIEKV